MENKNEEPVFYKPLVEVIDTLIPKTVFFSVLSNSPAINSGTPDTTGLNLPKTDYLGNARIAGGKIDIGAFELPAKDLMVSEWMSPKTACNLTSSEHITTATISITVMPTNSLNQLFSRATRGPSRGLPQPAP